MYKDLHQCTTSKPCLEKNVEDFHRKRGVYAEKEESRRKKHVNKEDKNLLPIFMTIKVESKHNKK